MTPNEHLLFSVSTVSPISGTVVSQGFKLRFTVCRYGWRYQIGPWVRKGSRVIVPDMLGYGGTEKPTDASEYSTKKLCSDLAALLDLLGIRRAVSISVTATIVS